MQRRTARLATLIVVVIALAACGILNGIFGDAAVGKAELCARVTALETDANACLGVSDGEGEGEGGGASVVNSVLNGGNCSDRADCLGDNGAKSKCAGEWHSFVSCELDDADKKKDCSEISGPAGASGFCGAELDAYVSCSSVDLANCSGGGGSGCNGPNTFCEPNDDPNACNDCCGKGACGNQCGDSLCGQGESCPEDCGGGDCDHNGACELGENNQACPDDCDGRCNHDNNCSPDETPRCADCGGVNPQCNINAICENGEDPGTCPDDCNAHPCTNPNNICEPGENQLGCGDCNSACNHDHNCTADESPQCDDCNNGGGCGDSICRPEEGEDPTSCPPDCVDGECQAGAPDGICEQGENSVGCSTDCNGPCNHNATCDGGEPPSCQDCATCPDNQCDFNESPNTCPQDCQPRSCVGAPNGVCEGAENALGCPADCPGLCNHDGTCQGPEDFQHCDDCTNGEGNCDPNGLCDGNETAANCAVDCDACKSDGLCTSRESSRECGDCLCNVDSQCIGGDVEFCTDCDANPSCAVDADCGGGGGVVCDRLNQRLCNGDPVDPNCTPFDVINGGVCRSPCSQSNECPANNPVCVSANSANNERVCEHAHCNSNDPSTCPAGFACVAPYEMFAQGVPGFCAHDDCDPTQCPGGGCACNDGGLGRCATKKDPSQNAIGFACTVSGGNGGEGDVCNFEGDCDDGETCFQGTCRDFCNDPGGGCPNGTCHPLSGPFGACAP